MHRFASQNIVSTASTAVSLAGQNKQNTTELSRLGKRKKENVFWAKATPLQTSKFGVYLKGC